MPAMSDYNLDSLGNSYLGMMESSQSVKQD